ncbi:hypothetical protein AB0J80_30790 [Actinoplanes sp. NPDC049548]|uniref:hypothetical protein n=1 Tax=Actinoplanes sp. NPDC049548 TaxID=3155152 RepID=UPI00342F9412
MMLGAVLVLTILVALIAVSAWPAIRDWRHEKARSPEADSVAAPAVVPGPGTLEGVLARQLMDQEISRRQYMHAMEALAERDRDRHPLPDLPEDFLF